MKRKSSESASPKMVVEYIPTEIELRLAALKLYKSPFRCVHGRIYDKDNETVADEVSSHILRVRGWGRIGYLKNPELLRDTVGVLVAEALTEYWKSHLE